jgi:hypothetical protein
VGFQGRQGDLEALRSGLVFATRPQEMGSYQPGGARCCEGAPVRSVAQGVDANVASKPSRIAFETRRGR